MIELMEEKTAYILEKAGIEKESKIYQVLCEFFKFGIVGITNVGVSYFLNICTLLALKSWNLDRDYVIGNLVAFFLSVLWSFYWNNKYVFKVEEGKKRTLWRALLKTYLAYSFSGILLNNILSFVWIDVFHISKYISPLLNLIVTVPVNFVLNKLWAFREDRE